MVRALFLTAILSLAGACASSNSVHVKGETNDVVALSGDWEGQYQGIESGRAGTIEFSLGVGRHSADGQVLMYPDGSWKEPTPLRITFVQVKHGTISGTIDPYMDPQCACEVQTEFTGTVQDDAIRGSFTTKVVGTKVQQSGNWQVERVGG